jgi:hypothetical protein
MAIDGDSQRCTGRLRKHAHDSTRQQQCNSPSPRGLIITMIDREGEGEDAIGIRPVGGGDELEIQ